MLDDGTVCIAIDYGQVFAGPTCDELSVTFAEPGFTPTAALDADGRYLVGGAWGGILSSTDGQTWTKVLWQE